MGEPGVREVDHVITTAELGAIFKARRRRRACARSMHACSRVCATCTGMEGRPRCCPSRRAPVPATGMTTTHPACTLLTTNQ